MNYDEDNEIGILQFTINSYQLPRFYEDDMSYIKRES